MIEMVFALLLLQDHKIIEHRYHESLSQCMKARRYAMKDKSNKDRVVYKCIQSKANVEVYMGEKKILSLISNSSNRSYIGFANSPTASFFIITFFIVTFMR